VDRFQSRRILVHHAAALAAAGGAMSFKDVEGLILGDSIAANYNGLYLMLGSCIYTAAEARTRPGILSLAQPFRTIDDNIGFYNASVVKGNPNLKWVICEPGFNNIIIAMEDAATIIGKYNTLIADINSNNPTAKIILSVITPARRAFDGVGPGLYATWLTVNAAIRGTGVTGSNIVARVEHTQLNDGTDNLKPEYDSGDDTHPNNAGRLDVMGANDRAALVTAGLL
jgi:hypothetical protein